MFSLFFSLTSLANTKDSLVVDKLNKEALDLAYTKPKEALTIAFRSLKLASSKGLSYGEVRAYIRIGIVYDVLDKNELSINNYNTALKLATATKDSMGMGSSYNNLGLIYWKKNQLNKALDHFQLAYNLFEKIKKLDYLANVSNNIGLIYDEIEKSDLALKWYFKTLTINDLLNDDYNKSDVFSNIGNLYAELNKSDSAAFYLNKAINGYRANNNLYGLSKSLDNYATVLLNSNRALEAIPFCEEALLLSKKIGNDLIYFSSAVNLSIAYKKTGRFDLQRRILEETYPAVEKSDNNELKYKFCQELSSMYFQFGDIKKGYYFQGLFFNYYNLYYKEKLDKNILSLEKKLELKEAKQKAFYAENARLKSELISKQKSYWIVLLIFTVLLITLFSVVYIQKRKSLLEKEKNQAILKERDSSIKARDLHMIVLVKN
jgi:tetratricopeptide (TPR) repeat protein